MAADTNARHPNVVKTDLDDLFYQAYDKEPAPSHSRATDTMVFQQTSMDNAAHIDEVFGGSGQWVEKAELADVNISQTTTDQKATNEALTFANSLTLSKRYWDDGMHDVIEKTMHNFGRRARTTQDDYAFGKWRDAFTTFTTNNGIALISDAQSNANGDTIDNKLTDTLTETSLNDAIVKLYEQLSQDGVQDGMEAYCLLVPPALYKKACEILESEWRSGTADNDANVYSSKYGIMLKQSNFLGATAGGSDTAWFLMADDHSVQRRVREGINNQLIDYRFSTNDTYTYKGRYREVVHASTYEGVVGSDGTTTG